LKRSRDVEGLLVVGHPAEEGLLHVDPLGTVDLPRKSLRKPNNLKQRHLMRLLLE